MAPAPTMVQLYQQYHTERATSVSEDQFATFAVFFPTLIIIISDGVIDLEEWDYVKQLARFMAKTFQDEGHEQADVGELTEAYLAEISYLIKFLADWREPFLSTLENYLTTRPEAKASILDTIELFAEASEGTSPEEQAQIDDIKQRLRLQE